MSPFHLAIQVHDLTIAREFYKNILHCTEGRSDDTWVDLNFFGHQLVCHLNQALDKEYPNTSIKKSGRWSWSSCPPFWSCIRNG